MSDFGAGKYPIAKKYHLCEFCNDSIEIGEKHFHFTGKWQGDFQDWRMHLECQDAHQRETEEGEICEERHRRGETCEERDNRKAKQINEEVEYMKWAGSKGESYSHIVKGIIESVENEQEEYEDSVALMIKKAKEKK